MAEVPLPAAPVAAVTPEDAAPSTPWGANPDAHTAPWADKSLYLILLGFLLPIVNAKFGWGLTPEAVVAAVMPIITFVAASKWKQAAVVKAQTQAKVDVVDVKSAIAELSKAPLALFLIAALTLTATSARAGTEPLRTPDGRPIILADSRGLVVKHASDCLIEDTGEQVGPGCWMSEPQCIEHGQDVRAMRLELMDWRTQFHPTWVWLVGAGVLGALGGWGLATALHR